MDLEDYTFLTNSLCSGTVTRVSLEQWAARFIIDDTEIFIESEWNLINESNEIIDRSIEFENRKSFESWRLLFQVAKSVEVIDPDLNSFRIIFENGFGLNIFANDDGYEDWHVNSTQYGMMVCNGKLICLFP